LTQRNVVVERSEHAALYPDHALVFSRRCLRPISGRYPDAAIGGIVVAALAIEGFARWIDARGRRHAAS